VGFGFLNVFHKISLVWSGQYVKFRF
jgi:hypothetical protein